jgi:hypothetical protein
MKLVDGTRGTRRTASINRVSAIASGFTWINVPPIAAGRRVSEIWKIIVKCDIVDVHSVAQQIVGEHIAWLCVVCAALIPGKHAANGDTQGDVDNVVKQAPAIRIASGIASQQP